MDIQELERMPLSYLRHVDVRNAEDEAILQRIINAKLAALPTPIVQVPFVSSETDNMTIEKERELQAKIDARNEENRAMLQGVIETPETIVEAPIIPETIAATEPVVVIPETITSTRYCDFCDSKGGAHKKICTREV